MARIASTWTHVIFDLLNTGRFHMAYYTPDRTLSYMIKGFPPTPTPEGHHGPTHVATTKDKKGH